MKALIKEFFREIHKTRGRFLSILILVALAVAFLSGLRATAPDMKLTLDEYMDESRFMDVQVLSSLGLTDGDVRWLKSRPTVEDAEGIYLIDAYLGVGEKDHVVKVWSLPRNINKLKIREGRLPENGRECALDAKVAAEFGLGIGDIIRLRTEGDYEDCLAGTYSRIVGIVSSPYYISPERGNSSLGTGSSRGYVYLHDDAFSMDYYTAACIRIAGAGELEAYSDEYCDLIEAALDELKPGGERRAELRREVLVARAEDKIAKAEREADEELDKAAEELADAKAELEDARKELDDGWADVAKAKRELASQTEEAEEELADARAELADALAELNDGEKEYADGLAEYEKGMEEIADSEKQLEQSQDLIDSGFAELARNEKTLNEQEAQLDAALAQMAAGYGLTAAQLKDMVRNGEINVPPMLSGAIAQIDAGRQAIADGRVQLNQQLGYIHIGQIKLDEGRAELQEAADKLAEARAELDEGWSEYRDGLDEVAEGEAELEKEVADANRKIADAEKKLRDGEAEYADGVAEYEDGLAEYEDAKAEAEEKIADARDEISSIGKSEWYFFDRDSNPGYLGFGQDADRMGNLARVFPLLFFTVAALVCLTTMTRMVDEQRTQIGCLKALGYGRLTISMKYIVYGALPALIGGAIGLAVGYTLFPKMIFTAWQIMYDVPNLHLRQYTVISVLSVAAAVFCTTFSTWVACVSTLRVVPAELMRPRSPKPGKRVILEYIKPLWKRLNFNRKVAARNLLRYKKRFWMTILGIGGCTALIIAGFGLRSSLLDTMKIQYEDLYEYQAQIVISPEAGDAKIATIKRSVADSPLVEEAVACRMNTGTASTSLYNVTAYLQVMESSSVPEVIRLRDYDSKETITLDDSGAVIDLKLSEMLGVSPGDTIDLDCDGYYKVRIAAVTEHYLGHFIYMTPAYYESVTGKEYDVNAYLLRLVDGSKETCDELFSQLLDTGGLASVSRVEDVRDTYQSSMERVDFVVVIVILSAAALAMVVLFNLSNINMTERRRELATIKVLGFYDVEVTSYVARENVVLTILGIAVGIGAGHFLHTWLVRSVEIELMMFGRETDPMSYLWAGLLTAFFSFSVNIFAHRSMKKIDMVESLKSAE